MKNDDTIIIRVPADLKRRLRQMAEDEGVGFSKYLREILKENVGTLDT